MCSNGDDDSQPETTTVDTEKCKFVAIADAMKIGEQRVFSPVLLRGAFNDRRSIDGTKYETPQLAFLHSLIAGRDGHYTLCEDRRGYILTREDQPIWHR
jgi:hypothetical protein